MDFIYRAPRATIRRTPHCTTLDNNAAISHDKCKYIFEGLRKKESHCEGGDNTVFVVSNAMLIIIKRSYYD